LGESAAYQVRGSHPDTASMEITVTPRSHAPGLWDLVLDLYVATNDSLVTTVQPADFAVLGAVPIEGANEDALFAAAGAGYPNPARSSLTMPLRIPEGGAEVLIEVYNSEGRLVWKLGPRPFDQGQTAEIWELRDREGRPVESGSYYRITRIGDQSFQDRFTIVR
jgi:hypothetical protein